MSGEVREKTPTQDLNKIYMIAQVERQKKFVEDLLEEMIQETNHDPNDVLVGDLIVYLHNKAEKIREEMQAGTSDNLN